MIEMIPEEYYLQLYQELRPLGIQLEARQQCQEKAAQEARRERIHKQYDEAIGKKRRETDARKYAERNNK